MEGEEVTFSDLTGIDISRAQKWFLKSLSLLPDRKFNPKVRKAMNVFVAVVSILLFGQMYFALAGLEESIAKLDFTTITNCVGYFAVTGSLIHKFILMKKNKESLFKIGIWAKYAKIKRGDNYSSIFFKVSKGMSIQHYVGGVSIASIWLLYPLMTNKPLLPAKYPFSPETFALIYSYPTNFLILFSVANVTSYSISMFMHIIATFCDEAYNLSNDWSTIEFDKKDPKLFRNKLKSLTKRHVELLRISKDVQIFHDGFFGFELFVSIAVMFYTIVGMSKLQDQIVTFLIVVSPLALVVINECFIVCWFGDEITAAFKNFHRNIYNSNWLDAPVEDRRCIAIIQEFTKKPIIMTGATIFTSSRATFIMALRESFSLYTVLNTVLKQD